MEGVNKTCISVIEVLFLAIHQVALFGWLEKRLMLMLVLICCERKTLLFR
jgi:hypothetical protein